eukprot:comp7068_c0_seq1/m.2808 comp7068_c0_seq1/g.2808  ORF comp7068_c0_seq1/g.2808 comp7068_c0_seq1/m.2808 type:complete len:161 (-) comp7068_c0_seq1:461-943(-)
MNCEEVRMATKRRNPFGEASNRQCKQLTMDPTTVQDTYARTLSHLRAGGQAEARLPGAPAGGVAVRGTHTGRCWVCKVGGEALRCCFCERDTCGLCVRQCERCQDTFCSFCSTTNFDARYDRVFCLSCNEEEKKTFVCNLMPQQPQWALQHVRIAPGPIH